MHDLPIGTSSRKSVSVFAVFTEAGVPGRGKGDGPSAGGGVTASED